MKRKEMRQDDIDEIVKLYKDFDGDSKLVKKVRKEDLYYFEVLIQQPYQRNFAITEDRIPNLYSQNAFSKLYDEEDYETLLDSPATDENLMKIKDYKDGKKLQELIIATLNTHASDTVYKNVKDFERIIKKLFPNEKPGIIKAIVAALSEKDKTSDVYRDRDGNLIPDSELNDVEFVPALKDYKEYFAEEVEPFVPDAWAVFNPEKIGCEISFNKYFYEYKEPESVESLLSKLKAIRNKEVTLMGELLDD